MSIYADNSFFHRDYHGTKVMVIVPHEDDEINTSGALLYSLSKCGAKITVVYTTNGDWKYPAKVRINEAVKALAVLGVRKDSIIFLGYGDSYGENKKDHIFYHQEQPFRSVSGYMETYGSGIYNDYAFQTLGKHHEYTALNYLKDIVAVIEQIRPNLIVCTDFDNHPDHRMLSLYLDKAVGIVKKREPSYSPEILKRFAYTLAYTADDDFSAINNSETKEPPRESNENYKWGTVNSSFCIWENRIRIPFPQNGRECDLKKNIISKALVQHRSQYIITKADRIINSDEIYWSRRTDSISYNAKVTVSSGCGDFLTDFMLYDVKNIDDDFSEAVNYCWKPDENDTEKTALLSWEKPFDIESVILYGAVSSDSYINKLSITLSDGFCKVIDELPSNGNPLSVDFKGHVGIVSCEIRILSARGLNYGISECEIYQCRENIKTIKPFCKILIDDNFAYEYIVDIGKQKLPLKCYTYGDTGEIELTADKCNSKIILDKNDRTIIIKAENSSRDIYDLAIIKRTDSKEYKKYNKLDCKNRRYLKRKCYEYKLHNMLYILKHQGIISVLKRTYKNVIRPQFEKYK